MSGGWFDSERRLIRRRFWNARWPRWGERLSLALANLRLREALQSQSIRDTLTGLYNRWFMEQSLARELGRSSRSGQPFSLMMMDIDHFKRFNET
jgi:GGDEF domain-containing protein